MKKLLFAVNAVVGALLLTAVTVTAAVLFLMFSTAGSDERSVGLFGALFFQSTAMPDGSVQASMGLVNPIPVGVIFFCFVAILLITQVAFVALRDYRARLIAAGAQ